MNPAATYHVPDVSPTWLYEPSETDYRPHCNCGWAGEPKDNIVNAARTAKRHADLNNDEHSDVRPQFVWCEQRQDLHDAETNCPGLHRPLAPLRKTRS